MNGVGWWYHSFLFFLLYKNKNIMKDKKNKIIPWSKRVSLNKRVHWFNVLLFIMFTQFSLLFHLFFLKKKGLNHKHLYVYRVEYTGTLNKRVCSLHFFFNFLIFLFFCLSFTHKIGMLVSSNDFSLLWFFWCFLDLSLRFVYLSCIRERYGTQKVKVIKEMGFMMKWKE